MKFISYTAISIGFIVVAAAEGFCVGLLLSFMLFGRVILNDEGSAALGFVIGAVTLFCAVMSALF
jgi:hypothetical protein